MIIISCRDKGFPELWGQLWERQACQAPIHTQAAYAFYRQRPLDEGAALVDYSFVVVDDGNPVAGMQVASISKEGKTNLQAYEVPAFVMEDPEIDDRRRILLGGNEFGQLGDDTTNDRAHPIKVGW